MFTYLHIQAHDHTSYLHYISLIQGFKMGMLHFPPLTNRTVLNGKHPTSTHVQKILHHNTWYFTNITTPATI
jgi:hypothetical protein